MLSAALCLAGVGLLTLSSAFGFGAGEAFCLAAALLYASAILVTDRLTHGKMDALAAGVVQVGTIGALGLVSALLFETPRLPQGGTEWLGILVTGVRLPAPSRRKALATVPALGYNEEKTGNCR